MARWHRQQEAQRVLEEKLEAERLARQRERLEAYHKGWRRAPGNPLKSPAPEWLSVPIQPTLTQEQWAAGKGNMERSPLAWVLD